MNEPKPIEVSLGDREFVSVTGSVAGGVLAEVRCCTTGDPYKEQRALAVLRRDGVQHIDTPFPIDRIRAVDPTVSVMVVEEGSVGSLSAARVDGTGRRALPWLGFAGGYVVFY